QPPPSCSGPAARSPPGSLPVWRRSHQRPEQFLPPVQESDPTPAAYARASVPPPRRNAVGQENDDAHASSITIHQWCPRPRRPEGTRTPISISNRCSLRKLRLDSRIGDGVFVSLWGYPRLGFVKLLIDPDAGQENHDQSNYLDSPQER